MKHKIDFEFIRKMAVMLPLFCLVTAAAPGKDAKPVLYIPEGQLLSHPVTVYVANTNLGEDAEPTLSLIGLHTVTQPSESEQMRWPPRVVAPGQDWTEVVAGKTISREGTLLIFDLSSFQAPWYKAAIWLNPSLSWNAGATNQNSAATVLYMETPFIWA